MNETIAPAAESADTALETQPDAREPEEESAAANDRPAAAQSESGPESAPAPLDPALESAADAVNERLVSRRVQKIREDWARESEAVKEIYPAFSLENELKGNRDFRDLLKAGITLRRAYETVHLPEILREAMRWAAAETGKRAGIVPREGSSRVQENAVLDRAASIPHREVKDLTERDILRILDSVGRGAKISF